MSCRLLCNSSCSYAVLCFNGFECLKKERGKEIVDGKGDGF